MKQLVILFIEFALIIVIVFGIYYANLSKKAHYLYKYQKPIMATRLDLNDLKLREEIYFFLTKDLGLYTGEFQILDVVSLYTEKITGADYILITLETSDGNLYQITLTRNFLPWAKWEIGSSSFSVIEPLEPLLDHGIKVPKWMQDLGVTKEQLDIYYKKHPEVSLLGEYAFFDEEIGKYKLPSDWHQTIFTLKIEKGRIIQLVPDKEEKLKANIVNSYWQADYPIEYLGLGYREYLYKKIKTK